MLLPRVALNEIQKLAHNFLIFHLFSISMKENVLMLKGFIYKIGGKA